jgi:predicted nucleic acid-binding protein
MSGDEIVVDASLALKWVLEEPHSVEAKALLEDWRSNGRRLIAPALFLYEVTNTLAKRMQRRELTLERAKELMRFFLESGPILSQLAAMHPRALELMERFRMRSDSECETLMMPIISRSPSRSAANAGPPMSGFGTWSRQSSLGCAGSVHGS